MPILLTCTCGKKLKVGDDKVGKRVKCPGCQAVLSVPAQETADDPEPPRKSKPKPAPIQDINHDDEDIAPPKAKAKPAPVDEDYDEDEELTPPPRGKKSPSEPKKKSGGKLVLILGLVALLLLFACGGGGAAIYYFGVFDFAPRPIVANPKKDEGKIQKDMGDDKAQKDAVLEPRTRFTPEMGATGDARSIGTLLLSQDGTRVAVVNGKYKSQMWDIAGEPKKLRDLDRAVATISPDGSRLVEVGPGGAFLVDVESGAQTASVAAGRPWFESNNVLWGFEFSQFKNTEGRKKFRVISTDSMSGKMAKDVIVDHKGDAFFVSTGKAEIAIVANTTREVQIWDLSSGKWTREITLKGDAGTRLFADNQPNAISPDGKWLLVRAGQGAAVFDLTTGDVAVMPTKEFFPHTPAFVANRDLLMFSTFSLKDKNQVTAYSLNKKAVVARSGPFESVSALAVSGDGHTMATGTREGEVLIWDLKKLN